MLLPFIDSVSFNANNHLESEINNPLLDTVVSLKKHLSRRFSLEYQFGLMDSQHQLSLKINLPHKLFGQIYLNAANHGIDLLKFW